MLRTTLPLALLLALVGCERRGHGDTNEGDDSGLPDTADTGDTADTADTAETGDTDTGPAVDVDYTLEVVKTGAMTALLDGGDALASPTNNYTYVLDVGGADGGKDVRFLGDSYMHPTGDWCVDERADGECARYVYGGRVVSSKPSRHMCLDRDGGRLFLVKDLGQRLEIADVDPSGDDAYTYNNPASTLDVPAEIQAVGRHLGPCEHLAGSDALVLSSVAGEGTTLGVIGATDGALRAQPDIGWAPSHLVAVDGGAGLLLDDPGEMRVVRLETNGWTEAWAWRAGTPVEHLSADRETGRALVSLGTGGGVVLGADGAQEATRTFDGAVRYGFFGPHGLEWWVTQSADTWTAWLVEDGTVLGSHVLDAPVTAVAEPGDLGDLVVFTLSAEEGSGAWTVLGAKANASALPPLNLYLLTTIEEPSDANMGIPCTGSGSTFEQELALVRNNAAALASLGVPVAMAITDNFAEKAEECGQTAIYEELADLGLELGAMLHNRPCYNCSDKEPDTNADYCPPTDPYWGRSTSETSCFPDDPEYCDLGDWACYDAFLQPRAEVADRNIPGGAAFIVGGDRHGMWEYDWIRFYQEVEREAMGRVGYDLTMFAGTWAYNDIDFDDPRGKDPSPWRQQDRTATWHPGDIDHWDRESAYSSLLYLPGVNSATVKIGEQQATGLYMLDFFEVDAGTIKYDPTDYDVQYEYLRRAVAFRKEDRLNAWSIHIHDCGTTNLRDASGNDVMVLDTDGSQVAALTLLQRWVEKVNERFVPTGEVQWLYPTEIQALDVE